MNEALEALNLRESRRCAAPANAGNSAPHNWLHQAAARFCCAMTLQAPTGYEDEAGFHFGAPSSGVAAGNATSTSTI